MNKALTSILASLVVVLGLNAQAGVKNPLQRACMQKGGSIENLLIASESSNEGRSENQDEVSFCRFGSALIGAESLLALQNGNVTDAVKTYKSSAYNECGAGNEELVSASAYDGSLVQYCQYSDGSRIEVLTLKAGYTSEQNQVLNQALGL